MADDLRGNCRDRKRSPVDEDHQEMKKIKTFCAFLTLLAPAIVVPVSSQDEVALENQLRRAKKELEQLESEKKKVRQATQEDYQQFKEYQQRAREKFRSLKQNSDSLNRISSELRKQNSILGSRITSLKSRQREYDIYQEKGRAQLERLCDTLLQATDLLSPLLKEKLGASLKFLKSEIQAATSDNVESMNRLFSILGDLDNRLMSIEVEQGTSPVPGIAGVTYRLRIGGIFESIVNEKGSQAAIWNFNDRKWELIENTDASAKIRKAVSIRIGKSVPELVALPLSLNDE